MFVFILLDHSTNHTPPSQASCKWKINERGFVFVSVNQETNKRSKTLDRLMEPIHSPIKPIQGRVTAVQCHPWLPAAAQCKRPPPLDRRRTL